MRDRTGLRLALHILFIVVLVSKRLSAITVDIPTITAAEALVEGIVRVDGDRDVKWEDFSFPFRS
jgi:hypothetical protein